MVLLKHHLREVNFATALHVKLMYLSEYAKREQTV